VRVRFAAAHAVALELDAMSVVNDAIQYRIAAMTGDQSRSPPISGAISSRSSTTATTRDRS
jgi:hypothetical protein